MWTALKLSVWHLGLVLATLAAIARLSIGLFGLGRLRRS
jgi:hypothetical protein